VVATPLGNLEDLSPRAVRILGEVHTICAEDTRHTRPLLAHFGITRPLLSLHEHNERGRSDRVLALLGDGHDVALVSDAGTPGVSDPGSVLVAAVVEAGYRVSPVPGPSALATALSVSGFAESSTSVLFLGFLEPKGKSREEQLLQVVAHSGLVVLYESPHRVADTLSALAARMPTRRVCLGRELTKLYEEVRTTTLAELATWAQGEVRGEITLVLGPLQQEVVRLEDAQVDAALKRCLAAGLSARDASTAVAAVLTLPRREVYARCQMLRAESDDAS